MVVQAGDLFVQPHFRRIKRPPKLTLEGLFILLILHLAAVQLCIHLGTALGHSRGHVHIVLMRALQT